MVVAKTNYGSWRTYVGTLPEVVGELKTDGITLGHVASISYDGTDWVAVVRV